MLTLTKRAVILGASGFIGSSILEKFLSAGNLEVKGFSSSECDLLCVDKAQEALSDLTPVDALIVASAITRLKENSFDAMLKNIQMSQNLLDILARHPAGQVVFLSTVDVYGINIVKGVKISEGLKLEPNDYYALSKVTAELLLQKRCHELALPLTILRLSGVYGPRDQAKSAIGAFISLALKEKKMYIYGKGDNLRDYVYVDDLYKIIYAAIQKKTEKTINVATGKSYAILQIAQAIKSLLPHKVEIEFRPQPAQKEKRIADMVFDTRLLKSEFPEIRMSDIRSGISAYLTYLQKGAILNS